MDGDEDLQTVVIFCHYGKKEWIISQSAITMCQQRYPYSTVGYVVADLFSLPPEWLRKFDLVYECNTIQILSGSDRVQAVKAISDLVAPEGNILV